MSDDKIERILATYRPVEGRQGYVWMSDNTIVKVSILREIYEEEFKGKGKEK